MTPKVIFFSKDATTTGSVSLETFLRLRFRDPFDQLPPARGTLLVFLSMLMGSVTLALDFIDTASPFSCSSSCRYLIALAVENRYLCSPTPSELLIASVSVHDGPRQAWYLPLFTSSSTNIVALLHYSQLTGRLATV